MTTQLASPKALLALFVLAAIILLAWSGIAWGHPSIGADLGYPTEDCGKNWSLFLQWQKKGEQTCVVGSIDAKIVNDQVSAKQNMAGPDEPGTIKGIGHLDEVLKVIADKWTGR